MRSFKSLCLCFLLALISVEASAQWRPGPRPNPRPTPAPVPAPNDEVRLIEVLNRSYQGVSTLPVLASFTNINQYRGWEVRSVELQANSNFGRGTAGLIINNAPARGQQIIPQTRRVLSFDLPQNANILGESLRQLQFDLRGQINVQRIAITLAPVSRLEVIERRLSYNFRGDNMLLVGQDLNLFAGHRGKDLQYVEFTASSMAGRGQAILQVNGQNMGLPQIIGPFADTVRFDLSTRGSNVLGQDIRSIQIRIVGNVQVSHLAAGVLSQNRNPAPPPLPRLPQTVTVDPNVVVTGNQTFSLTQMLSDARHNDRRVQSITVQGRSRNGVGRVRVCESLGFRTDCRGVQNLGTAQTTTTHYLGGARLRDLNLEAQGQLMIQRVTVQFE